MKRIPKSVWFLVGLIALTGLASWHAGRHGKTAAAAVAPHRNRQPLISEEDARRLGWAPPHDSTRWECIVIHHSATDAGGAGRFDRAHRDKGWAELGYHFVIGNGSDAGDGEVEVGHRWTEQTHGAHCYTRDEYYNNHGIGVCVVGNLDRHNPTRKQVQNLAKVVRYLCRRYDIPADCVYVHGDVTGQTRCPGGLFDIEAIRASVRQDE